MFKSYVFRVSSYKTLTLNPKHVTLKLKHEKKSSISRFV